MKSLFAPILLLFTFPVLADELILACTYTYVNSHTTVTAAQYKFDPINKTFLSGNYDDNDRLIGFRAEEGAYVDETAMGTKFITISRLDGSYKKYYPNGELRATGTCVPVTKKAF